MILLTFRLGRILSSLVMDPFGRLSRCHFTEHGPTVPVSTVHGLTVPSPAVFGSIVRCPTVSCSTVPADLGSLSSSLS